MGLATSTWNLLRISRPTWMYLRKLQLNWILFEFFLRWRSDSSKKGREYNYETTTKEDLNSNAMGSYNWTEIERYDATDLQLRLQDLEAFTKYEILLQAYNQFGRGPVAKIEAETLSDGNNKMKFA